eukprot:Awhi_evm1s15350
MREDVSLSLHGQTLAALSYEISNTDNDIDGFIFGREDVDISYSCTDNQTNLVGKKHLLNIRNFEVLKGSFTYYDQFGKVDENKLETLLGTRINSFLGCFRWRRNSVLKLGIREKFVFKQVMNYYEKRYSRDSIRPPPSSASLVFGLFTSSLSSTCATFTFDHLFLSVSQSNDKEKFLGISTEITNLDRMQLEYRKDKSSF